MTKHKCVTKVCGAYRDVSGPVYPCLRPATVERDGQWYCWQHDPERVEADAAKHKAVRQAKENRQYAIRARRARNAKLASLVTPELAEMLEVLACAVDEVSIEYGRPESNEKRDQAYVLAARIREMLNN